jgi:dephospho-CoA kinase
MSNDSSNPPTVSRQPPSPKPVIGLIGGIGSGKSRVAALLAQRGGRVVSGDAAGHEALRQPGIRAQVVRRWGRDVLDEKGEVNRRRLAAIIFADPAERQALEAMVFPWIKQRLAEQIAAARADPLARFVVLDAAVMLEAGWNEVCDYIVYIHVPRAMRLERLVQQRGWSPKEVEARENAQISLSEKASRADAAVDNSGSLEETARQLDSLLQQWGIEK